MDPVDSRYARPVFARLRRACLALPDTSEAVAWGHPVFRIGANGRTFCAFEILKERPTIALGVTPADAKRFAKKTHFTVTPYGRGAYVSRWLDVPINWRELETLLRRSYRGAAAAAATRRRRNR
ncbi:MAG TPA: MmcQ/YjbR family DNA-binding protein [Vicinamibacterales bacterium]|nr:MmcQ/YjbR family DNA-binding protein [Vicinamibacterales bacterium]